MSSDNVKLLDTYNVGVSITSLDFSTNWSHLNIGSDQGCMYTYDINAPGSATLVMNEHNGNFIGVQSLAPGFDQAVVSKIIQIRDMSRYNQVLGVKLRSPVQNIESCSFTPKKV